MFPIPDSIRVSIRNHVLQFTKLDGEWFVLGCVDDLPIGEVVPVWSSSEKELINVEIIRHVAQRAVRHEGDSEDTMFVLARFI